MHGLEEGTVYYVHNTLELNYVFMPVPGPKPRSVLLFGPFLYEAASGRSLSVCWRRTASARATPAALRTFYGTVPEVAEPTMAAAAHAVACQLYGAHDPARVVHRTAGFHRDGPGAAGRGVPVFHGASGAALPR